MSILAMADYSKSVAEAANIVNGGEQSLVQLRGPPKSSILLQTKD